MPLVFRTSPAHVGSSVCAKQRPSTKHFCILVLSLLLLRGADVAAPRYGLLQGCGQTATLTIAATAESRRQGIRRMVDFGAADGMAFVYAQPTTPAFWMHDTVIPLDIFFLSPTGRLLARHTMAPLSDTRYTAPAPILVVLEFPVAAPQTQQIHIGTTCQILLPTR